LQRFFPCNYLPVVPRFQARANKRIISIDVQGITGKRKSFSTLPYSTIQFFEVQTQGFIEIFPDTELFIQYANGFTAQFEFKGNVDICKIGKLISSYVLR